MEYGKQMKQARDNALVGLYQNPGYQFERREKKTITIDKIIGAGTTFSEDLLEPLIIDRLSDVYLDSFLTYGALPNAGGTNAQIAFLLKIDQLDIQSNSTNNKFYNKIIIPNEDADGGTTVKVHKGKKQNYICSLNPGKLSNLSGTVTKLDDDTTMFAGNGRFIAEFMIVARD